MSIDPNGRVFSNTRGGASHLTREHARMNYNHGVDRWGKPFLQTSKKQIRSDSNATKRMAEARQFQSSAAIGSHQADLHLRKSGYMPPKDAPGTRIASDDRPHSGVQAATFNASARDWNSTTCENVILAPSKIRGYSSVHTPPPSMRRREHTIVETPSQRVKDHISRAEYQPTWFGTGKELNLKRGQLDDTLPRAAKTDLCFHPERSGGITPQTSRFAPEVKQNGYRNVLSNELSSNLTQDWSHCLRGQRW